ncbi:MAG TPA: hypothetical protein VHB27_21540 [Rhodopila sp.]|uniref:ATP-grasp domain-containing protein n=1 Tax=Rhodopila sp. TaxID=2480087 RepID=UPI002CA85DF7|nr:hypothetical protein [Rhodopila sp.]HVY17817.1 hypothetical protein [Rhodopila sp.]
MSRLPEAIPALSDTLMPPAIRGVADLTTFAYGGNGFDRLMDRIRPDGTEAGTLFDLGIALQLDFRRAEGLRLQDAALARSLLFRVQRTASGGRPVRLLAVCGAGDLMVNAPLDFLTNHLDVRLDLLHVLPNRPLPPVVPDHDVAFFAHGDPDGAMLARLAALYRAWPRPVLNDPAFLPALARDALSRSLAGIASIRSPETVAVTRPALEAYLASGDPIDGFVSTGTMFPCLVRPAGTHAGHGLALLSDQESLVRYLETSDADRFYMSVFVDYADGRGLYRKSRVAFIDRRPFLCHMAVSSHWMVHYLNAGMDVSAEKRAEEAAAMAEFDSGFARRHAAAFDALHERLGFDFYSIDCAETPDGRLLVFEADAGAIIHMMDPLDRFAYKQPRMRRIFEAFDALLRRRMEAPLTLQPLALQPLALPLLTSPLLTSPLL